MSPQAALQSEREEKTRDRAERGSVVRGFDQASVAAEGDTSTRPKPRSIRSEATNAGLDRVVEPELCWRQTHIRTNNRKSKNDPQQSAPSRGYSVPPPYWSGTYWLWEEDCSDSSDVAKSDALFPQNGREAIGDKR